MKKLTWGTNYNLLQVNTVREVFILREHQISANYNEDVIAVQTSPTNINVYLDNDIQSPAVLTSEIQVLFGMIVVT